MSAQPSPRYQNNRDEEYARWRRRDHANIEAMQNLVIADIAKEKSTEEESAEMPPNVRHLISALQGSHGGGEVAFEEFSRDYLTIGKQLQFTGSEDTIRARVRRWLDDLDSWQFAVGFELFTIQRGGQVVGYRPDGSPIRKKTVFIDHLKPKSDEAVQRARYAPLWKQHPGRALEEQVAWLKAELPKLGSKEESGKGEKGTTRQQPLHEYEQKQEERIEKAIEEVAEKIEHRGGNGAEWVDRMANNLYRLAASLKKTERARRDYASLSIFDDEPKVDPAAHSEDIPAAGTANTCDIFDLPPVEGGHLGNTDVTQENTGDFEDFTLPDVELGDTDVTQASVEQQPVQETNEAQSALDTPPNMLEWALGYAKEGKAVVPLHTPDAEGKCSCRNPKCPTVGKHPRILRWQKDATTDEETIRRWWRMWPEANIGFATGAASGFDCLDIDPRAGGDDTISQLIEIHGELPKTREVKTGGKGKHIYFVHSDVQFKNSASSLGEGLDIKTTGGLVVAPPSLHVSGNRYEWICTDPEAPMPLWVLEKLTKPKPKREGKVREKDGAFVVTIEGPPIPSGRRNKHLFRMCSRFRGEGLNQEQIEKAALEINAARCQPPMDEEEVRGIAESVMRYEPDVTEEQGEPESRIEHAEAEAFQTEACISQFMDAEGNLHVPAEVQV